MSVVVLRTVLMAFLLLLFLAPLESQALQAHTRLCEELEDPEYYMGPCEALHSQVTRCGSFCFYAICVDCEDWSHTHSCGEDCSYSHDAERSPCIEWTWHLYDPALGRSSRSDSYDSHNLAAALDFGMVPEGYVPPIPPCIDERSVETILPAPAGPPAVAEEVWVKGLSSVHPAHYTGLVLDSRAVSPAGTLLEYPEEVSLRDLSHLPETPGEPGGPVLISVKKVDGDDRSVVLDFSSADQYRYWSYNGLREEVEGVAWADSPEDPPTEFRVPFEDLTGPVVSVVEGLRGIVSFQVRNVDLDGVPSGHSNIEHQMVGMEGFHTIGPPWPPRRTELEIEIPLPSPGPTETPLPTLEVGSRPVRPVIDEVLQVDGFEGTVEVRLLGSYPHDVEYRWWPHSGFIPTAAFEGWCGAGVRGGSFRISGVEPLTPVVAGAPSAAVFDFQVRLVDGDGVAGDPSEPVVLLVWGGNAADRLPRGPVKTGPGVTVVPIPVPSPFPTPRSPDDC